VPGVCDNRIAHYEMPDARLVYRDDGQLRSFAIASMISWRGVWYAIPFEAILRATDTGTVDDPALGDDPRACASRSGTSAYSPPPQRSTRCLRGGHDACGP